MVGSRGSLEFGSVSVREQEVLLRRLACYDMTLMEEEHRYHDHSEAAKVARSSSLKGTTTIAEDVADHGGGASKSTFLAKREC